MTIYVADPPPSEVARSTRGRWLAVLAVCVALVLAGLVGYGLHARAAQPHVGVGRAYVGLDGGTVKVDGWNYGFAVDTSMNWYDHQGSNYEGSIPPCMRNRPGFAWIRFGWSTAYDPTGHESYRAVTWVECVARP